MVGMQYAELPSPPLRGVGPRPGATDAAQVVLYRRGA